MYTSLFAKDKMNPSILWENRDTITYILFLEERSNDCKEE